MDSKTYPTGYIKAGLDCPRCRGSMFGAWDLGYSGGGPDTLAPSPGPVMQVARDLNAEAGSRDRAHPEFVQQRCTLLGESPIVPPVRTDAVRFVRVESVQRLRCLQCSHREEVRR